LNPYRSTRKLADEIANLEKDQAIKLLEKTLNSFLFQTQKGINILEAFDNSINAPSNKKASTKKKRASKKELTLERNREIIFKMSEDGASTRTIAEYLNRYRLKRISVSHTTISKFLKKGDE
jgi:hypothetical protein